MKTSSVNCSLKATVVSVYKPSNVTDKLLFVGKISGSLRFPQYLMRLDYFLCYLKYPCNTMPNTKKQIEQFLKVYDKNIQKGVVYLAPNGFLEVEYKLIGGCNG